MNRDFILGVRLDVRDKAIQAELKDADLLPRWLTRAYYVDIVAYPDHPTNALFRDTATTQMTNLIITVDDINVMKTLLTYMSINLISREMLLSLVPTTTYQKGRILKFVPDFDVTTLVKKVVYDDQGNPTYTYWSK